MHMHIAIQCICYACVQCFDEQLYNNLYHKIIDIVMRLKLNIPFIATIVSKFMHALLFLQLKP